MTDLKTTPIVMYGAEWCGDCRRARRYFETNDIPFDYIDLTVVDDAADKAKAISGRTNIPVVVFPDGTHQVEPTDADLSAKLAELAAL